MEIFINILIISFILYTVVGVTVLLFRVSKNELKLKKYKKNCNSLQNTLSLYDNLINQRVDREIDRTNLMHDEAFRYIDRRIDNLEGNITPKQELLKG